MFTALPLGGQLRKKLRLHVSPYLASYTQIPRAWTFANTSCSLHAVNVPVQKTKVLKGQEHGVGSTSLEEGKLVFALALHSPAVTLHRPLLSVSGPQLSGSSWSCVIWSCVYLA